MAVAKHIYLHLCLQHLQTPLVNNISLCVKGTKLHLPHLNSIPVSKSQPSHHCIVAPKVKSALCTLLQGTCPAIEQESAHIRVCSWVVELGFDTYDCARWDLSASL